MRVKNKLKIKKLCALAAALSVSFAAGAALSSCVENNDPVGENGGASDDTQSDTTTPTTSAGTNVIDVENVFSERDLSGSYDEETSGYITLADGASSSDADGVKITDDVIEISDGGTYIISGSLSDGRITVDAGEEKVCLVLSGADITCSYFAALYVKSADKTFITLAAGTENFLSSTGEFTSLDENNVDGVIFSKDDLTLNGSGSLTITAEKSSSAHGIVGKDDLVITGGTYTVNAAESGINGKDCIGIAGGNISISAGTDGIHAENSDDSSLGYVYIAGGNINITADSDGIEASSALQINGGEIIISADGKGIKAGGDEALCGGTYNISSKDDAFHSNGSVFVSGGEYSCSTSDDGFHADETLYVSGGYITVTKSYEGLEGNDIIISGGSIDVTASDDGINAAGGNDESGFMGGFGGDRFNSSSENCTVTISGGVININAQGDGVDSNGSLSVTCGSTYVSGPTGGGNGALDYASSASITGGVFIAVGSSDMAMNFSSATQGAALYNTNSYRSGEIILSTTGGEEILSYTPQKNYSSVLISCPDMKQGESYTLSLGGEEVTITLSSLIYGSSNGMGGGGFNGGGGFGGGGFGGGGRR